MDSDYADAFLYNLVDSTFKSDYNENLVQKAKFEYDKCPLDDASGAPMHDLPPHVERGNLTKKTEWINSSDTRSQQYWYDICGNLVEMKDYMGYDYEYDYCSDYVFPDIMEYPDGSKEYFNFDKKGRLTSVTDRSGIVSEFEYDIYGRTTKYRKGIPGSLSLLGRYKYDDFKRKAKEITYKSAGSSDTTIYSYDGLGRLINFEKCAPTSVVKDYIYNCNGQVSRETQPRFSDVSLYDADYTIKTFDGLGRVTEIEYPRSSSESGIEVVTYEYRGDTTDVIDELDYKTTLINDASGNLIQVIDALGNYTDYYYDVNGNLDSIIDAEEKKTNFEYDWLGNLVRREGPDRGENTFEYYPNGNVSLTVNNSGDSIFYEYDELGRITTKAGPGLYDPPPVYITDTLFYDTEPQDIVPLYESWADWELNEDISQWERVYISFLARCGFVYGDGSPSNNVHGICTLYVYFEDPVDTFRRYFVIYEGSTGANTWGYSPNSDYNYYFDREDYGNIISGIKIKHTRTTEFDETFPSGYYPGGNWADSIKNVLVEGSVYDSLPYVVFGDTLEEYFYDGYTIKDTTYTAPSGLEYPEGRLTGFENENVREVYFYDKFGNLGEKWVIPFKADSVAREFEYFYDLQGRLTHLIYPNDYTIEYEYDKLGNISSVKIGENRTINLSSTAAGLLSGIHFPGGVTDTFTYKPRNWMNIMEINGIPDPYNREFEYNRRGELRREWKGDDCIVLYDYDVLGRITLENREGGSYYHNFVYDAVGNRLEMDYGTIEYEYEEGTNRLIADNENSYSYDANGRLSTMNGGTPNGVYFTYDPEGMLTEISGEENHYKYYYKGLQRIREEKLVGGTVVVEGFKYSCDVKSQGLTGGGILEAIFLDVDNNEIGDSLLGTISGTHDWMELSGNIPLDDLPSGAVSLELCVRREGTSGDLWVGDMQLEESQWAVSDQAYNYFYDNAGNLIMVEDENNPSGEPPTEYIYAGNRLLAKVIGYGNHYFYHLDRIGSPIIITDEDGNVVKEKKYEAFGNLIWAEGTHDDNREFTGKEKEPTGFHYFGARRYYGNIGRFLTPDPHTVNPGNIDLSNPQELNPYVYCVNNPTKYIDPLGLDWYDMGYDIDDEHYPNMQWFEGSGPQAYWSLTGPKIAESLGEEVLVANGSLNEDVNEATFEYYSSKNKTGPTATGVGNTIPSDRSKFATIAEGTYDAKMDRHGGQRAMRLSDNGSDRIPTVGNNPNPGSDYFGVNGANGILVHRGNPYRESMFTSRGHPYSEGCQTMFHGDLSSYNAFMSNFGPTWTGKYYLTR